MECERQTTTSFENSSKFEAITSSIKTNDERLTDISFLLSIFDNIVGPKIVHIWKFYVNSKNVLQQSANLNDNLLKYIAVHTLNGELYQDKLLGQVKYRLYFVNEINCAIFSVFFDAETSEMNTINSSYMNSMMNSDVSCTNSSKNESDNLNRKNSTKSSSENFSTLNNCLSLIFPLDKNDLFFKKTLLSSDIFLNYFENVILEFKVFAHIRPKVRN